MEQIKHALSPEMLDLMRKMMIAQEAPERSAERRAEKLDAQLRAKLERAEEQRDRERLARIRAAKAHA